MPIQKQGLPARSSNNSDHSNLNLFYFLFAMLTFLILLKQMCKNILFTKSMINRLPLWMFHCYMTYKHLQRDATSIRPDFNLFLLCLPSVNVNNYIHMLLLWLLLLVKTYIFRSVSDTLGRLVSDSLGRLAAASVIIQ